MAFSKKKSASKSKATSKGESAPAAAKGEGSYDNTNRGVLFPNDKEGNESRPDYTGKINVDGVDKRLAAWISTSDRVGEYLRISVSDFEQE